MNIGSQTIIRAVPEDTASTSVFLLRDVAVSVQTIVFNIEYQYAATVVSK